MDYYCGQIVIMVILWVLGLGNSAIVNDSNCFSTYRDFNGNLVFISFTSNYLLSTELFGCNEYLEISRINWLWQIIHCDCLACYLIEPRAKDSRLEINLHIETHRGLFYNQLYTTGRVFPTAATPKLLNAITRCRFVVRVRIAIWRYATPLWPWSMLPRK